ncbi:MAG TPA: helix-turn-helix transcriptional regulator, partial [Mycobacteriales bacterium]|nr:helix-turn-helix transcriptional regulator [Mycobacteriales bacterium]
RGVPASSPVVPPTLLQLGTRVRQLRADRGLTAGRLAEQAGLSVRGVLYLEHGHRDPRASTLLAIAAALGVGVGELFDDGPAGGDTRSGWHAGQADPPGGDGHQHKQPGGGAAG